MHYSCLLGGFRLHGDSLRGVAGEEMDFNEWFVVILRLSLD